MSNTVENDKSGGTRSISSIDNQRQIIYKENSDGSKVKTNIISAVEAVTGLATHKIQVFRMEEK